MMKFLIRILSAFLVLSQINAQVVPAATNYQGRLTDAYGNPAPDGSGYEVEVRLWPTAAGMTGLIWGGRYSGVSVKSGALNIVLGSGGTAISGAQTTDIKEAVASSSVFLGLTVTRTAMGISVANPTEVLPRQQWLSSPFAFRAEIAGGTLPGAVTSAMIADGSIQTEDLANGLIATAKIANGAVNLPDSLRSRYAQLRIVRVK